MSEAEIMSDLMRDGIDAVKGEDLVGDGNSVRIDKGETRQRAAGDIIKEPYVEDLGIGVPTVAGRLSKIDQ